MRLLPAECAFAARAASGHPQARPRRAPRRYAHRTARFLRMTTAVEFSAGRVALYIVVGLIVLAVVAGFVARTLVRHGIRPPFVVKLINRTSESVVEAIKRPITVAMLDEVADVLREGHYARNIASALRENQEQLTDMIREKIKQDPTGRHVGLIPFHDRLITEASETALRVILEVLADPRTDELISDLLRDNLTQIRSAVRERE